MRTVAQVQLSVLLVPHPALVERAVPRAQDAPRPESVRPGREGQTGEPAAIGVLGEDEDLCEISPPDTAGWTSGAGGKISWACRLQSRSTLSIIRF